jgi:hypothetical protein
MPATPGLAIAAKRAESGSHGLVHTEMWAGSSAAAAGVARATATGVCAPNTWVASSTSPP